LASSVVDFPKTYGFGGFHVFSAFSNSLNVMKELLKLKILKEYFSLEKF
jgi:hypothetical protein